MDNDVPSSTCNGTLTLDVLVVGGGTAGTIAAVSAARSGASVALVERQGFFGGTMTGVTLGSLCGFFVMDQDENPKLTVGGLPLEVVNLLKACGGAAEEPERILKTAGIPYDPYSLKRVLDELLVTSGVRLFSHTWVSNVIMDDSCVVGVRAHSPRGTLDIHAKAVIDASGNAVVAAEAGVGFNLRNDAQNPTAMFRFGGVDIARAKQVDRPQLHSLLSAAVADGLDLPRTAGGMFSVRDGIMHVNVSRVNIGEMTYAGAEHLLDPEILSRIEVDGRRQVSLYERAFREYVPGFEGAFVLDSGTEIGLRESRRIRGIYELSVEDVRAARHFDDGIVCSAWPVEAHGEGRTVLWEWPEPERTYQIPLRSLIPGAQASGSIDGLVVAGRILSADPLAHASARVAAQCMAMGEAAGILAATSAADGTAMRNIPAATVRTELLRRGAYLS